VSKTLASRRTLLGGLALAALLGARAGWAQDDATADEEPPAAFEQMPPRLAFVEGEVSFWRSGAEGWTPALANLPLARGDRLYAGERANLEIQLGARAFLRAGSETELALESHEPLLRFGVGSGIASLDLRSLPPGHTIELDTPNAAFTIEDAGYYRLDVDGDTTTLTSRRGGSATLTPARGEPLEVGPSEQVVVTGENAASAESYAAPELDDWDLWNYRRTDRQLDSLSARYVSSNVYGVSDLDAYGSWRTVAPYGPIWIPRSVRSGWAPYGFGRWVWDPIFGWTWLDDAPWGWAPFHHGRWIFVTGHWAWAPGPIVVRPYYAPALVAFFGTRRASFGIWRGAPAVAWVPLGWGEPCLPWWGPARWVGRPHWLGWGGPRVVNKIVIERKTVVHADAIHEWENAHLPGGLVAVAGKSFGRQPVDRIRLAGVPPGRLEPVHGAVPVERAAVSFTGSADKVHPPPKHALERSVVATRPGVERAPEPRLVPAPRAVSKEHRSFARPPFGTDVGEERAPPKPPPSFHEERKVGRNPRSRAPSVSREPAARVPAPEPGRSVPRVRAPERVQIPKHDARAVEPRGELPGEPANRVYRGRSGHERSSRGDARGTPQGTQPGTPSPGLRVAPGLR